jgi:hypothetical protein
LYTTDQIQNVLEVVKREMPVDTAAKIYHIIHVILLYGAKEKMGHHSMLGADCEDTLMCISRQRCDKHLA